MSRFSPRLAGSRATRKRSRRDHSHECWNLGHRLCRFTATLRAADQNVSVRNVLPAEQLLDPSRTHARRWRSDHFDDVVINELGQQSSIVDRCLVAPHDPIVRRGITFNPVAAIRSNRKFGWESCRAKYHQNRSCVGLAAESGSGCPHKMTTDSCRLGHYRNGT